MIQTGMHHGPGPAIVRCALLVALTAGSALAAPDTKYLRDFEFIRDTVAGNGAAVRRKKIDWPAACARLRPLFAECDSDEDHVKNVMRLLAVLRDSHTGVTRHNAGKISLPKRGDGLFGGGLWLGWDRGLVFLQGMMKGHSLEGTVPLGSVIRAIDGEATWLALEREKRRMTTFTGSSSDHSLFSSLDNRLLPFGEKDALEVVFLTPGGKTRKATVRRWGPGGKAFYAGPETVPDGLKWAPGAVSGFLESPWCEKLGYLRITGGMNPETVSAVHAALDRIRGLRALVLDCRRMGGGGDDSAWEIAGRFFPRGVDNGINGRIEASGSWQFDGPIVMLQDEVEVSSAETFTWAMSETRRTVSVGRPTGGWAIIPRSFSCPSGLVHFRLGTTDRGTPIGGIHTEGKGWPPDVLVPYGPVLSSRRDPVFEVGLEVLRALHGGEARKKVVARFAGLLGGEVAEHRKALPMLSRLVEDDLSARLAIEAAMLGTKGAGPPDARGVSRRLADLASRAKAARLRGPLSRLEKAVKRARAETAAQEVFLEITDAGFQADEPARTRFLRKHRKTVIADFAREHLWR